jgi:hypothetical protein
MSTAWGITSHQQTVQDTPEHLIISTAISSCFLRTQTKGGKCQLSGSAKPKQSLPISSIFTEFVFTLQSLFLRSAVAI